MSCRWVVVVERQTPNGGPWAVWGVYDSVPSLRASAATREQDVPTRTNDWRYPWRWTDHYGGAYRAHQRRLDGAP